MHLSRKTAQNGFAPRRCEQKWTMRGFGKACMMGHCKLLARIIARFSLMARKPIMYEGKEIAIAGKELRQI